MSRTNISNGTFFIIAYGLLLKLTIVSAYTKGYCFGHEFECKEVSYCIRRNLICDGIEDCPDSSDEIDCQAEDCANNEFRCPTNFGLSCLPNDFKCDGETDCNDGYDEANCHRREITSAKRSGFYLFDYLKNRRIKEDRKAQNTFYKDLQNAFYK